MFKPSGPDSIPVPIRVINWYWRGRASRPPIGVIWGLDDSHTYVSGGIDVVEHPVWSTRVQSSFMWEYFNPNP